MEMFSTRWQIIAAIILTALIGWYGHNAEPNPHPNNQEQDYYYGY